jgi:hypothetical protein
MSNYAAEWMQELKNSLKTGALKDVPISEGTQPLEISGSIQQL